MSLDKHVSEGTESRLNIDWLSFTFKIADLRHCERAGYMGFTRETQPYFPKMPKHKSQKAASLEQIDVYNEKMRAEFSEYYTQCLKVFVTHVLGLSLSPLRDKGFQFYENSFNLHSDDGSKFCGLVGIGGNNDTVHFQINATGCKHVLARRSAFSLHHWLHKVLGVQTLSRIDIAYDDFDGIFDCDYALTAAYEDAFRLNPRGRSPKVKDDREFFFGKTFNERTYTKEQISVGSRQSPVYWRIYNKKLEQKIDADDFVWYRSEVELKKWNIDILLNIKGGFAALNDFARSIESTPSFHTKITKEKRPSFDLLNATYWLKRQYGGILNDLLELYNGNSKHVLATVVRDSKTIGLPRTYSNLLNMALE